MCIVAEWQKMKAPSFLRACRVTTQKVLYFIVFLASLIRGAYFTSPVSKKLLSKIQAVIAYCLYNMVIIYVHIKNYFIHNIDYNCTTS